MATCTCGHDSGWHIYAGTGECAAPHSDYPASGLSCDCQKFTPAKAVARNMPRYGTTGWHDTIAHYPVWRVVHVPAVNDDSYRWVAIPPGGGLRSNFHWFPTWQEAFDYAQQQATR